MKESQEKSVCVVGLGYIGLPTALVAAQHGYTVKGFDIDEQRVRRINAGKAPIIEPEVEQRLADAVRTKSFQAYDELPEADYYIIAVPTPFKYGHTADLSYVFNAGSSIARVLKKGAVVIIESTIPVGTTKRFAQLLEDISDLEAGKDFHVAHCPERVLPGNIFKELISNDRVIGGTTLASARLARAFYQPFVQGTMYTTTASVAEMVKLTENSHRDAEIAFANQLASMCDQAEINVYEVIELANKHPRVNILQPGCGVGGHCIAVDPWFLIETFPNTTSLLKTARTINDAKPHLVFQNIIDVVQRVKEKKRKHDKVAVTLLGLTFKPDIDDLRESPALIIARELQGMSSVLDVSVCEPHISDDELREQGVGTPVSIPQGLAQADVVVALVKHTAFLKIMAGELAGKEIIDTCGLMFDLSKEQMIVPSTVCAQAEV